MVKNETIFRSHFWYGLFYSLGHHPNFGLFKKTFPQTHFWAKETIFYIVQIKNKITRRLRLDWIWGIQQHSYNGKWLLLLVSHISDQLHAFWNWSHIVHRKHMSIFRNETGHGLKQPTDVLKIITAYLVFKGAPILFYFSLI